MRVFPLLDEKGEHVFFIRLAVLARLFVPLSPSRGVVARPGVGIFMVEISESGSCARAFMGGVRCVLLFERIAGVGIVGGVPFGVRRERGKNRGAHYR